MRPVLVAVTAVAVTVSACSGSASAPDEPESSVGLLETVRDRGYLACGVSGTAVGFSYTQADGSQRGFDADYCRAVAAAVLGDADAVAFVTLTSAERIGAVQTGAVDVLFRTATHTQTRDTHLGVDFGPVIYYDGQRLMARASDGYTSSSTVADIDGAVVCANAGTTTERNIVDAAAAAGVEITLDTFENHDIVIENFVAKACDIVTGDGSGLVGRKNTAQPEDQEWVIFPPAPISKEPLAPVYAQGDPAWGDVIDWVVYATIIADEKGITSVNVDGMAADPPDAEAQRLLGGEGELQSGMGLAPDAFHQAIRQVGNYDEIFERHLVPVGLAREGSPNASWRDGGLIYAPPAR
ncbi:MAG: amino acid ABC transporter substrate-binding protein [Acidimicrobiaceae bacterium]|nr:amino acid ABC transporter substrate-binding protein [Acidimicrobiaceae bacterium]